MLVGLTYDLKSEYLKMGFSDEQAAEFDKEETIEGIENSLNQLGYKTERIGHIKQLVNQLVRGKKWDIVFNICEGVYGIGREAQVPALLDAYNIPYVFSNPLVLSLTLHKAMTKRVIRDAKVATPDFYVVYSSNDIKNVNIPFPIFAKPLCEGTGKGISSKSIIYNIQELNSICNELLEKFKQPVLVEKYLPGREFTVGIVGTGENAQCVGVIEVNFTKHAEASVYSYTNKDDYYQRIIYTVPETNIYKKCEDIAIKAWQILECEDGGRVDVRMDENGILNFIEVNPLPGLNYIHSDLPILAYKQGFTYTQLIEKIMNSATKKLKSN